MGRKATNLENRIMEAAAQYGVLLMRNPVGFAWTKAGRPVRYGLMPGSSDLVGIMPGGRWICVEVKAGRDVLREHQEKWLANMAERGAVTIVARSVEDVTTVLESICG